uniref:Secreted protein n=1 Tax=Pipistrellus kuhlii TaxID=59472 RepID=A0A7J7X0A3_PIPKU|nr:hypothetical protein mPipKuh1_010729 [Pipistrellus kuhlii]
MLSLFLFLIYSLFFSSKTMIKNYIKAVVGKLISQQSQISTVQRLKFLVRANIFKLKLLLKPVLQDRLAQAVVFCGRATLKGPKNRMWLASRSLPTTNVGNGVKRLLLLLNTVLFSLINYQRRR